MSITIKEIGKAIVKVEMEKMKCPMCGSKNIILEGCCGNEKWKCTECDFYSPRKAFLKQEGE